MPSAVPLAALAAFAVPLLGAQSGVTLLLVHGKVWTGGVNDKPAEAVAIAGNRVAAVGSSAEILKLKRSGVWTFDLHGHLVLPGFDDERVHFYQGGADLEGPQLRLAQSQEDVRDTLADFAYHVPKGRWILGGNWDYMHWRKPRLPAHKLIDSVTGNCPTFLKSADGRIWLANKAALRIAGIDRNTPDPPGGTIMHDAKGNPTGILTGTAGKLVERVIPPPTEGQIVAALEQAEAYANARGVTSIRDVSCTQAVLRGYRTLLQARRLTVRVRCVPPGAPEPAASGSDWDNAPMDVAAYAKESAKCSIAPGKPADLVVLSNDLFNADTQVIATIVNGVPVYGHLWPVRDKSGLILR